MYVVTSLCVCLSVCVGIRAVAECMVKSSSEQTCEVARRLLYCLAVANPRFTLSVYKGLVALFSCDLPIVQRMAAMTVRRLQVYRFLYRQTSVSVFRRELKTVLFRSSFPDAIWQCTVLYLRARRSVLICHHVLAATNWFYWHCTVVLQQQCDNAT